MKNVEQNTKEYFIPTPPEIHIGMKCELWKGKWCKVEITSFHVLKQVFRNLDDGKVRVALLSDATLQEEGWTSLEQSYTKGNFSLTYNTETERLEVFYKENRIFAGKCKGVNTFHSICILLKV